MIPENNFDPYQTLIDTQQAMIEIAQLQNLMSQQIVQIFKVIENLNARQDILNEQLKLVKNSQKSLD